ncbi:MAG: hypothetical protein ACI85N_002221 [Gammaproteobacteria bacterium]|jgi:hypothetical protein
MTHEKKIIIAELIESQVIVEENQLIINSNEVEQTIALTEIKQLSIDGDIKYIRWFLLLLIPISIALYAFSASETLPTFLVWALLTISGVVGLVTMVAPPERDYIVINMKQGNAIRLPMNDKIEDELEFIRKTNVHIYNLEK